MDGNDVVFQAYAIVKGLFGGWLDGNDVVSHEFDGQLCNFVKELFGGWLDGNDVVFSQKYAEQLCSFVKGRFGG